VTARAYLSLGSNLGDKRAAIAEALRRLDEVPGLTVVARSADYRTLPWGDTDQDWFVNACAAVDTTMPPPALLGACLATETAMGRVRARKWGPRRIDIDIIDYDGLSLEGEALTLPHPFALDRPFVLVPLAEIAPDLTLRGVPVREALDRVDARGIVPLDPDAREAGRAPFPGGRGMG
jgi:2-amino-4-hydroxy-6-hydroxymethyldihydropteridine diphosphokinase